VLTVGRQIKFAQIIPLDLKTILFIMIYLDNKEKFIAMKKG
jgi:hypothetical protein